LACAEPDPERFPKIVAEKRLVGATAYQCASHPLFLRQRFDRAVVDEAGQMDEPSTLAPLSVCRRFVLGGDHLQLPPVVQTAAERFNVPAGSGLELSLFERLFRSSSAGSVSPLRIQYRMNREVQEIPSRVFYGGTLIAAPVAATRRLSMAADISDDRDLNRIVSPDYPVVFADVPGGDGAKASVEEAVVAANIVRSLLSCGVPAQEIGIITPYRAQQALIRKHLAALGGNVSLLTVDTVDRFQGGEREVIILSLARSDGVTSFLADQKRLNVSLTRARSKLILLGHGAVLEQHPLFRDVLGGLERITIPG